MILEYQVNENDVHEDLLKRLYNFAQEVDW